MPLRLIANATPSARLGLAGKDPPDPPDPPDGQVRLLVVAGDRLGHEYAVGDRPLTIGRAQDSDICLPQDGVSRRHATISVGADGIEVRDEASTNGTWLNDRKVDVAHAESGDVIRVGRAALRVMREGDAQSTFDHELWKAATLDGLTQVFNRRAFSERMRSEIEHARRMGQPVAVLLLDLDRFQSINEAHGSAAGDDVLRQVAERVKTCSRPDDAVARVGGGAFALLLPNTEHDVATALAETVRTRIEGLVLDYGGRSFSVTASMGVASLEPQMRDAELLERAEARLGRAKHSGRNCVVAR